MFTIRILGVVTCYTFAGNFVMFFEDQMANVGTLKSKSCKLSSVATLQAGLCGQNVRQRYRWTDRRTDRRTTAVPHFALCVRRAKILTTCM